MSSKEKQYVLIRHFSKENFVYVEIWNVFRGMSFNLSFAFIIIGIELIIKSIISNSLNLDWIFVIIGFVIMAFLTLKRAITFHNWSHNSINETIEALDLLNKKVI